MIRPILALKRNQLVHQLGTPVDGRRILRTFDEIDARNTERTANDIVKEIQALIADARIFFQRPMLRCPVERRTDARIRAVELAIHKRQQTGIGNASVRTHDDFLFAFFKRDPILRLLPIVLALNRFRAGLCIGRTVRKASRTLARIRVVLQTLGKG